MQQVCISNPHVAKDQGASECMSHHMKSPVQSCFCTFLTHVLIAEEASGRSQSASPKLVEYSMRAETHGRLTPAPPLYPPLPPHRAASVLLASTQQALDTQHGLSSCSSNRASAESLPKAY